MAASAADIRSALSLPERGASAGPSQPRKTYQPAARKPEGISRELYSLIGPSAPSLAAQLAKPKLKKKPNFGVGGVKTKWYVWRCYPPFSFEKKASGSYGSLKIVLEVMVLSWSTG